MNRNEQMTCSDHTETDKEYIYIYISFMLCNVHMMNMLYRHSDSTQFKDRMCS